MLMLVYFVAMHSNAVLLLLLGLPFDRALPWHKLLALSTLLNAAVHAVACYAGTHHVRHNSRLAREHWHVIHAWGYQLGMQLSGALTAALKVLESTGMSLAGQSMGSSLLMHFERMPHNPVCCMSDLHSCESHVFAASNTAAMGHALTCLHLSRTLVPRAEIMQAGC